MTIITNTNSYRYLRRRGFGRGGGLDDSPDDLQAVVMGLVVAGVIFLGMGLYFGRQRLREYCKARHQTVPVSSENPT